MASSKNPQQLQFQGSAQSKGFQPLDLGSAVPAYQQYGQQQSNALRVAQELEGRNLDAVGQYKANMAGRDMAALSKFSATLGRYLEDVIKTDNINKEVGQYYDVLMDGFENDPTNRQSLEKERETIQELDRQGDQVARTANDIEARTGNPVLGQAVRQQFGQLAGGMAGEKALLMQAQGSYGSFMGGWLESGNTFRLGGREFSVKEAVGSGDPRLVQAAITAGRHEFIRTHNLQYATKANFISILGNTMLQQEGALGGAAVRAAIKGQREEQISQIEGLGYTIGRNGTAESADADFHSLSDQFFRQNTGMTRAQANEAAIKILIEGAKDAGNVDLLESLLDVQQVPGQAGTELSNRYGNLIYDGIDAANGKRDGYDDQYYNDVLDGLEESLAGVTNLEERQGLIDAAADDLESQGLYRRARELRNNYQSLEVEGGSEFNAQVASDAIVSGEIVSPSQVKRLRAEGKITAAQEATLIKQLGDNDVAKDPTLKSVADQWQDQAEAGFLADIGLKRDGFGNVTVDELAGDEQPLSPAEAKTVTGQMRRDMLNVGLAWLRANPGLSDSEKNKGLNNVYSAWVRDNLNTPGGKYYAKDIKGKDGQQQDTNAVSRVKGYVNPAWLNTGSSLKSNVNIKPVDFSANVTAANGITATLSSQFRPARGDSLFTVAQVKQMREQMLNGTVNPLLQKVATGVNMTPLQLLNQQIAARPNVFDGSWLVNPEMQVNTPRSSRPSSAPTSAVQGANLLMSRFGLPSKGAAWLAGNVQTESSWNGQRSWDDVGARAGGIASWRAERLKALEAELGMPIERIPNDQQLAYLVNDLKTNYPNQWRVFMNPHATNRQLLDASYQYWRWGEQGDRAENAARIEASLGSRRSRSSRPRPSAVTGTGAQRAVQVGRQLLSMGTKMWQHPNFSLDGGYSAGGGQRVGQHSENSHHYAHSALDIPLSHNSQQQLLKTFDYLRQNMKRLGIVELYWDRGGFYKNGRRIGAAGSNVIPNHDSHIHVSFS